MTILRIATIVALLSASTATLAGPLYGTVRTAGTPATDLQVTVGCPTLGRPAQPPTVAATDQRGSFSMRVPVNGRCQMQLRRGNRLGQPFDVYISDNALRFDLDVDASLNRVRP